MNDEPIPLEDEIYEEEIEVEEEPSVMMAMWGEITGDIDNQTDLKEALDAKQNNLTQAQLDAVNSGIDSTKVATYDGYQAQINTKASQSALDAEAEARRQADSTLQGNIDAEETARKASDKDIQDVLDGETLARQNADIALGGRIDTEIHDRRVADIGLQGQIDAITSKSDVVDVVATYADLQAYDTQHLGDNDVIKVLDDETHGDALTYYRWSKTNQTWTFIGQEAPYYSKSQTDTLLLAKQNTIDNSHKLSADLVDDTSTTNKFVTAQDKTNWNGKQDALTAGTGIDITGGVISTPAIVPEVVTELPTTGAEGKLYLTPKAHTTSTASGNPIEATVTDDAGQLESFQLDGDTFQQSYTGKNLANPTPVSGGSNGVAATYNSQTGEVTVSGTAQTTWSNPFKVANSVYLTAGTYTLKQYGELTNGRITCYARGNGYPVDASTLQNTFTTNNDGNAYICITGLTSGNSVSGTIKFQLEAGSTATSYEPFVGGQPSPNPDYPQQIQTVTGMQTVEIVGKNLFDKSDQSILRNRRVSTSTGGTYNENGWSISPLIKVMPGETYTVGGVGQTSYYCLYKDGRYISGSGLPSNGRLTIPSGANQFKFDYPTANEAQIQLEIGSTPTAYMPYSKHTYLIDLGSIELCKLGDYQDYIYKDGDTWKVHKAMAKTTLDGSESWYNAGGNAPYGLVIDGALITTSDDNPPLVYCDKFYPVSQIASWSSYESLISTNNINGSTKTIRIRYTAMDSLSAFQTWLGSNNTTLYYALATATDTTITDTALIAQLEAIRTASLENGTNTITNTATGTNLAGDMEIGYYGFNPINRYDKFIWLNLNNNYEQIGGE